MHEAVRAFVDGLHDEPPADLAVWLREGPGRVEQHLREFDLDDPPDPRRVEDAEQVLPHLEQCAREGRTMTFTEFCRRAGRGNPRMVGGSALNPVVALCLSRGLPPLWTLVVRADTGLGSGYWREHTDEQKVARQEECFSHFGARRAEARPGARTARRAPAVVVREVCDRCYTERTPSGACLC